jgi:ribosomal protection tetracycline resistance protein
VVDCVVTMTQCGYYASDGPTKPSGGTTRTVAADFRKLTPLVVMRALERAKTVVCEPMIGAAIETPFDAVGGVLAAVARLGGVVESPSPRHDLTMIGALLPAARAHDLQRQLPGLTGGEGVVETTFRGYRPVAGTPPTRRPASAR